MVPVFNRDSVVKLIRWLWRLDLTVTYDESEEAPTVTYLLDDLMKLLVGGIYTIAYPTDYGKSTLVEMSVVLSLIFWPEDTVNAVIKANEDAAVAAARVCWWKLDFASKILPYCRPMSGIRQGNPEVKKGFFIEGSELRTFGGRDPSVYPAGIGDSSLPGRRGRAHFDDLETENTVKSEAKMDTLQKQFNSCVRLIQQHARYLFMVAGTPQGANSLMYAIKDDFKLLGYRYEAIFRPEEIQLGENQGKLLWPKRRVKRDMQKVLMDPSAYKIAYQLTPPGADRYDGERAYEQIRDRNLPYPADENHFRQLLWQRTYERYSPRIGFSPEFRYESDLRAFADSHTAGTRIYIGWDPATTGTFALHVVVVNPEERYILRSVIDSGTPDEQALLIRRWRHDWPSATVILEKDAQQLAFAHVLMHVDPQCPWAPHQTTGYNKDSKFIGIPTMMQEIMDGRWCIPWQDDDFSTGEFGDLGIEIRRWGPISHPHGIPSIWFVWHFEMAASVGSGQMDMDLSGNQEFRVTMPGTLRDPIQPGKPAVADDDPWRVRWPTSR
jgi:hypothetical protein